MKFSISAIALQLLLQNIQNTQWQKEPPEEVFGGGEEGLDGSAGSEKIGDGQDLKAKNHDEDGGTSGVMGMSPGNGDESVI
jgi:hypothetical protein